MDFLCDVKPQTLDSLYANNLIGLRDVILQLDNADYIEMCKKWIQKFNNAGLNEKVFRNCLLSLLMEQLKRDKSLSSPFIIENYNKNLNEIFECVGTPLTGNTMTSFNSRKEKTSCKKEKVTMLSFEKIVKHVSDCITEPCYKTATERVAEWIPDRHSSLELEVPAFCSDRCDLELDLTQDSPNNTDDLSEKLEDLNKIVFTLKEQNHSLIQEIQTIKGKQLELQNEIKEKSENLNKMEQIISGYKNKVVESLQLDVNLVNDTLLSLVDQFKMFVKGNSQEQMLSENNFQLFSNLFNSIFPDMNNNLASVLGYHDMQFKNLLLEMVKPRTDLERITKQNLKISRLQKCISSMEKSRNKSISNYEKRIKKILETQQIEFKLMRVKMIALVSTLLLKNNQKQEEEFIKVINSVEDNYKAIINKYFQTKQLNNNDTNVDSGL